MAIAMRAAAFNESRVVESHGSPKPQEMASLRWFDGGLAVAFLLLVFGAVMGAGLEVQAIALAIAAVILSVSGAWYLKRRPRRS